MSDQPFELTEQHSAVLKAAREAMKTDLNNHEKPQDAGWRFVRRLDATVEDCETLAQIGLLEKDTNGNIEPSYRITRKGENAIGGLNRDLVDKQVRVKRDGEFAVAKVVAASNHVNRVQVIFDDGVEKWLDANVLQVIEPTPEPVDILLNLLESAGTGIRTSLIENLGKLADPKAVPALVELLATSSDSYESTTLYMVLRRNFESAVVQPRLMETLEALVKQLQSGGTAYVPGNLYKLAAELSVDEEFLGLSPFMLWLNDDNPKIRQTAVKALEHVDWEPQTPADKVQMYLTSSRWDDLGRCDESVLPHLLEALLEKAGAADGKLNIPHQMPKAVAKIGGAGALPALYEMLKMAHRPDEQKYVIDAIADLAAPKPEPEPELEPQPDPETEAELEPDAPFFDDEEEIVIEPPPRSDTTRIVTYDPDSKYERERAEREMDELREDGWLFQGMTSAASGGWADGEGDMTAIVSVLWFKPLKQPTASKPIKQTTVRKPLVGNAIIMPEDDPEPDGDIVPVAETDEEFMARMLQPYSARVPLNTEHDRLAWERSQKKIARMNDDLMRVAAISMRKYGGAKRND